MQIKFITSGANSAYGGFCAGDTLRCSDEMARHLVDQKCAIYLDAKAQAAPLETKPPMPNKKIKKGLK